MIRSNGLHKFKYGGILYFTRNIITKITLIYLNDLDGSAPHFFPTEVFYFSIEANDFPRNVSYSFQPHFCSDRARLTTKESHGLEIFNMCSQLKISQLILEFFFYLKFFLNARDHHRFRNDVKVNDRVDREGNPALSIGFLRPLYYCTNGVTNVTVDPLK